VNPEPYEELQGQARQDGGWDHHLRKSFAVHYQRALKIL